MLTYAHAPRATDQRARDPAHTGRARPRGSGRRRAPRPARAPRTSCRSRFRRPHNVPCATGWGRTGGPGERARGESPADHPYARTGAGCGTSPGRVRAGHRDAVPTAAGVRCRSWSGVRRQAGLGTDSESVVRATLSNRADQNCDQTPAEPSFQPRVSKDGQHEPDGLGIREFHRF